MVKQKRFERRHPRRKHCRLQPVRRGVIHVPTVLAAVGTGRFDALGADDIVGVSQLPHVLNRAARSTTKALQHDAIGAWVEMRERRALEQEGWTGFGQVIPYLAA